MPEPAAEIAGDRAVLRVRGRVAPIRMREVDQFMRVGALLIGHHDQKIGAGLLVHWHREEFVIPRGAARGDNARAFEPLSGLRLLLNGLPRRGLRFPG